MFISCSALALPTCTASWVRTLVSKSSSRSAEVAAIDAATSELNARLAARGALSDAQYLRFVGAPGVRSFGAARNLRSCLVCSPTPMVSAECNGSWCIQECTVCMCTNKLRLLRRRSCCVHTGRLRVASCRAASRASQYYVSNCLLLRRMGGGGLLTTLLQTSLPAATLPDSPAVASLAYSHWHAR